MEPTVASSLGKPLNALVCVGIWIFILTAPMFFLGVFIWDVVQIILSLFAN